MKGHLFPGAVSEEDHDGTLATVDYGFVPVSCGKCGNDHVHLIIEPDTEAPNGCWTGVREWGCCNCQSTYFPNPEPAASNPYRAT